MSTKRELIVWLVLMAWIPQAFAQPHTLDKQAHIHQQVRVPQSSANETSFVASLSGLNETPPNNSTANGTAVFLLSADHTQLAYHIEYIGLSHGDTAKHIHKGASGITGPVIFSLPTGNPID